MPRPLKPKRSFTDKTAVMLIAAATITDSALVHQADLAYADTTYTPEYLADLRERIDEAVRDILGADNAAALRADTEALGATHTNAYHELGMVKTLIENKYAAAPARRDELLTQLGFRSYYTNARIQATISQFLSRFTENLSAELEAELVGKGLPPARVHALREYAETFHRLNVAQEGKKSSRTELTEADVITLNGLYNEVIGICRMAQRQFRYSAAIRDRFVYDKVTARESSYGGGLIAGNPPPVPAI